VTNTSHGPCASVSCLNANAHRVRIGDVRRCGCHRPARRGGARQAGRPSRAISETRAPREVAMRAVSSPMPLEPPVMITCVPASFVTG